MTDFDLSSYDFTLPEELLATRPIPDRHSSRLMVYFEETDEVKHSTFHEIHQFLPPESTLVFNRSRVFPCRLIGAKESGGKAEVFILSLKTQGGVFTCFVRSSGKRKIGDTFIFDHVKATIKNVFGDGTFGVEFNLSDQEMLNFLEEFGKVPIPPYIRGGESDEQDKLDYQTVYAKEPGSVAAPTAGLHFSQSLLNQLQDKGHELSSIVLHVGAGTFAPIKNQNILDHQMHEEFFSIDPQEWEKILKAQFRVAVGTTTLRALESYWGQQLKGYSSQSFPQSTSIFLHPGKEIQSIDALVTNFHLPKSSLIILVSAIIGRNKTLELYKLAIEKKYRFFSYGDGMLIIRKKKR